MRLFRNVTIKRKLMLIIMLTSVVALLLACVGFATYELMTYRKAMVENLSTLATVIGNYSTAALKFNDPTAAGEYLSALRNNPHIVSARIYTKDGTPLAKYPPGSGAAPPVQSHATRFDGGHLVVFRPIMDEGNLIGTIFLESDLEELSLRLQQYVGIGIGMLVVSLLVALGLSSMLQRVISEPVLHLVQTARGVAAQKDYSIRATKHGEDELGALIDGFNAMLGQIQERDAALQKARDELEKRVRERTGELQQEVAVRTRAEQAAQQQLNRISLINHITHAISERQDLESILQVALGQLEDHLPVEFGSVYLFDLQTRTLNAAASRVKGAIRSGENAPAPHKIASFSQTDLQPCFEGETVYLPDTTTLTTPIARQLNERGMISAVAVPLMLQNKLFGVLLVGRRRVEGFTSGECEFLRMLSEHVALAGHQARLYSELQSAYDELRQTQQAVMQQERLRALGQMASGIAHDINNALSPIVGFTELVLRQEQNLSESARKHLNYVKLAGGDIAHIVSRMRDFYRRRQETERLALVNLNQLAEQVIELTRPRWRDIAQARGVAIETATNFSPDLPAVLANESELREALINLILNAADAMPSGGTIFLNSRVGGWRGKAGTGTPTHAVMEVRDTGVGMDEATRQHCLEPFYSTKGQRGTGLGLAMVYGVMERHEGKIEIESQVGKGTTMRLVFPARGSLSTSATRATREPIKLPPLRLLCVDDEPLLRELMKQLLESDGHQVQAADGGQAGLDAFRAALARGEPFDAVITDLGMPHLDGRELARILKQESPATPVIMLTGWGAIMRADGDRPLQVDGLLSKPPRMNELQETLARVTQGKSGA
jgi:signal transduction histidine kinase/ActR/RegA family two-component response regulator/HAMP domain-containing protein